jgi:hypothetical protein
MRSINSSPPTAPTAFFIMADVMMLDDVILGVERSSTDSRDNPLRKEMMWRPRAESLVNHTRDEATAAATKHEKAAKRARLLYQAFGLPTVLIPLAGSVASQFLPEAAVTTMMVASGLCAGVNAFLNFGQKALLHSEYAARWLELASSIEFEMAKGRSERCAADVFLERLRNRSAALRAAEPVA